MGNLGSVNSSKSIKSRTRSTSFLYRIVRDNSVVRSCQTCAGRNNLLIRLVSIAFLGSIFLEMSLIGGTASAQNGSLEKRYHPTFSEIYTLSACTNDGQSASSRFVVFQEINEYALLASNNKKFPQEFDAVARPILQKYWEEIVSNLPAAETTGDNDAFITAASLAFNAAGVEIKDEIGVTVIVRGALQAIAPGCGD